MTKYAAKNCKPCEGIGKAYTLAEVKGMMKQAPGWKMMPDGKSIEREFITKNFTSAVEFINKITWIAESEDHHPDIHLTGYRKLKIVLSTHAVEGLTENDFIVAAKINETPVALKT